MGALTENFSKKSQKKQKITSTFTVSASLYHIEAWGMRAHDLGGPASGKVPKPLVNAVFWKRYYENENKRTSQPSETTFERR